MLPNLQIVDYEATTQTPRTVREIGTDAVRRATKRDLSVIREYNAAYYVNGVLTPLSYVYSLYQPPSLKDFYLAVLHYALPPPEYAEAMEHATALVKLPSVASGLEAKLSRFSRVMRVEWRNEDLIIAVHINSVLDDMEMCGLTKAHYWLMPGTWPSISTQTGLHGLLQKQAWLEWVVTIDRMANLTKIASDLINKAALAIPDATYGAVMAVLCPEWAKEEGLEPRIPRKHIPISFADQKELVKLVTQGEIAVNGKVRYSIEASRN